MRFESERDRNHGPPAKARAPQAGAPVAVDGRDEGAGGATAVCEEGAAKDEGAGEQARQADRQVAAQPVQLEAVPDGVDGGPDRQQDGSPRPHLPLLHSHQPRQPPGNHQIPFSLKKLTTVFHFGGEIPFLAHYDRSVYS